MDTLTEATLSKEALEYLLTALNYVANKEPEGYLANFQLHHHTYVQVYRLSFDAPSSKDADSQHKHYEPVPQPAKENN